MKNVFWIYNPSILFKNYNSIWNILPVVSNTLEEKLNSITRFFFYLFIFLCFVSNNRKIAFFPIIMILLIIFVYTFNKKYKNEKFTDNNKECRKPSKVNPFMNFTLNEHYKITDNPKLYKDTIIRACDKSKKLNKNIKQKFNDNILIDSYDIYNKDIAMRNFYTLPNTGIINDQKTFALNLYKNGAPCKQNRNCI